MNDLYPSDINFSPEEKLAWYKTHPVPHPVEEPYSCICTACERWYAAQLTPAVPGTLVVGVIRDPRTGSGHGSNSWHIDEEFSWGDPIRQPSIILGEMPPGCSGSHLKPVVVMTPDMGVRVTPKMWLRRL